MKLYFIRTKSVTNKLLIEDGWRAGMFVLDAETAYGPTFRLQNEEFTGYGSHAKANFLVRTIGRGFVGVTFEVVEYKPSES